MCSKNCYCNRINLHMHRHNKEVYVLVVNEQSSFNRVSINTFSSFQPPYCNTTYRLVDYTDVFYVDVDQNDGAYIRLNNSDMLDRETTGDTISFRVSNKSWNCKVFSIDNFIYLYTFLLSLFHCSNFLECYLSMDTI